MERTSVWPPPSSPTFVKRQRLSHFIPPVFLLSPAIKILEALILPLINDAVQLADHQHNFRKGISTNTALQTILNHINTRLNCKKSVHRTISVAIDLSRAFDPVDHQILLDDIEQLEMSDYI
ncbi:MAG: hypothetical protein GY696_31875 [Gammaproteobacteria bacterium]|nr:hypothetical protein [Gammaproteobacteria bacterium]